MSKVLVKHVTLRIKNEEGNVKNVTYAPGSVPPPEHAEMITNPKAWGESIYLEPIVHEPEIESEMKGATQPDYRQPNEGSEEEYFDTKGNLKKMTVPQLVELARVRGVSLDGTSNRKGNIIDRILGED
jgi:hypothetical protein